MNTNVYIVFGFAIRDIKLQKITIENVIPQIARSVIALYYYSIK